MQIKAERMAELEKFGFEHIINGREDVYYYYLQNESFISVVVLDNIKVIEVGQIETDWVDLDDFAEAFELIFKLTAEGMVEL